METSSSLGAIRMNTTELTQQLENKITKLKESLEWEVAMKKALLESQERLAVEVVELKAAGKVLVEANQRHFDTATRNQEK
jgi:hypothetical protein